MNEVLDEVADHISTITLNAPDRMRATSGLRRVWAGCGRAAPEWR